MPSMTWSQLVLLVLVAWVAVAVLIGTFVGHGIALGTAAKPE